MKGNTMFYRFLGRIFLYFWVLPAINRIMRPVIIDVLRKQTNKQVSTMTAEQKVRYESYMNKMFPKS